MPYRTIDAQTLKKWIDNQEAMLIDVREPGEYQAEKIDGAHLIPLSQLSCAALPPSASQKLVLQCHSGNRSHQACTKLLAENPDLEIYHLDGGLKAWQEAGQKTHVSKKFFLPLDRQVQVIIGLLILLASCLTYFMHPHFIFLTGFFGIGLIFAGLSGFCGLAILVSKMPWNRS